MRALRQRLRRPGPGAIVATLALFLAVGGGALAFSGSGTLQKANRIGLPGTGDPGVVVRKIGGIGQIRATCQDVSGDPVIHLDNQSGESLEVRLERGDTVGEIGGISFTNTPLADGDSFDVGTITQDLLYQYHVSTADGTKRPQADILVAIRHTDMCDTTQVAVINVTTEE